jgi:hypothetical protein
MDKKLLELYSDYLIASFSKITATGLSNVLDNSISHDKITRFLSKEIYDSKALWKEVKSVVRDLEKPDGVIILDDTIQEKIYTDENDIISWHFDHCVGKSVKGINILSCLYHVDDVNIPVSFEVIKKTEIYFDKKTDKNKRKSKITKNEMLRDMVSTCNKNKILFKYVLADIWFSAKDNMKYIKNDLKKDFIFAIKKNRLISLKEKPTSKDFSTIESLNLEPEVAYKAYLKGIDFPVIIAKQVFKNKDESNGILYLVSSDIDLNYTELTTNYNKRWNVECYHKSIKSNCGLAKSPTRTVKTQNNHFFMSIYSFFKLEKFKIKTKINHFALKAKIYISALKNAFKELEILKNA